MPNGTWTADLVEYYGEMDQKLYNVSDIRTRDWLFMRSVGWIFGLTLCYIIFTIVGPRLMADRKAFDLKWTMFAYNVFMSVFSLWMCLELTINSWRSGYTYLCDDYRLSYEPAELRIVAGIWWYFVSKPIEFLDTVFMVLKKKNNQISFLHVWHHSFMCPFLFMCVLLGPCGQALVGPIINSFIHWIMYGYYALSLFPALAPYLWWKKYLTQMQLVQFGLLILSAVYGLWVDCAYPRGILWTKLIFLMTLIVLFGNFYVQSYIKRRKRGNLPKTNETTLDGEKIRKDQ